jgi:hypothetical protein
VYAIEMLNEAYEQAVTCVKHLGLQETITVCGMRRPARARRGRY